MDNSKSVDDIKDLPHSEVCLHRPESLSYLHSSSLTQSRLTRAHEHTPKPLEELKKYLHSQDLDRKSRLSFRKAAKAHYKDSCSFETEAGFSYQWRRAIPSKAGVAAFYLYTGVSEYDEYCSKVDSGHLYAVFPVAWGFSKRANVRVKFLFVLILLMN